MRSTIAKEETTDSETAVVENSDVRECSRCARCLPTSAFRWNRRSRGQRHSVCRECRRVADQLRRAEGCGLDVRSFLTLLHRARTLNEVNAVVGETLRHFGGAKRFANCWMAAFDAAPVGANFRGRTFLSIMQLSVHASQVRLGIDDLHQALELEVLVPDRDFDQMTDQELANTISRLEAERARELDRKVRVVMNYLARLHADGYLVAVLSAMLDNQLLTPSQDDRNALVASLQNATSQ